MSAGTGQQGQEKTMLGQLGQDYRIQTTGQLGQDNRDRSTETEQPGQEDNRDRRPWQDTGGMTARTGQPG